MSRYTLAFTESAATRVARVGGKGANLALLTQANIPVPPGFCITTDAFDRYIAALPDGDAQFARLDAVDGQSVDEARRAAEAMRAALDALPIPGDIARDIVAAWRVLGESHPLAVRSSATAEDLPGASFAGQQDTYLNVQGEAALLDAVRRCWISLFTDRAVLYRARNRFGHRAVRLAVVVQRLVDPDVSGILFTADPVSGHRAIASVDAGFGLGEALVGGLISADLYKVDRRRRCVLEARPGDKAFAIRSVPGGGTRREALAEPMRTARVLDDAQLLALVDIGERIEAYYRGVPQDIEWCRAGGEFFVVQARPITSLYDIPTVSREPGDDALHVFVSFGHIQMMLDAMPRLALESWQYFFPAGKGHAPSIADAATRSPVMPISDSRLFIDVTGAFRVPRVRRVMLGLLDHVYEELGRSAAALAERPEFAKGEGEGRAVVLQAVRIVGPVVGRVPWRLLVTDPVAGARRMDRAIEEIPAAAAGRIRSQPTQAERIRQCAVELNSVFGAIAPRLSSLLSGAIAVALLAQLARGRWADGVRDDVETLRRGLLGNVTTEMDLAVGDLGDLVRPHPELAALLRDRPWREIRDELDGVPGGREFRKALERFLERYGDRGAGEIDVSRPRWRDNPSLLLRVIVGGLGTREAGSHRKQHAEQVAAGDAAARRLAAAAGPLRRPLVARLCRVARHNLGLREHPKFAIVKILAVVRATALEAGAELANRGQIADATHVWHLGFDEIARALDDSKLDLRDEVSARMAAFERDRSRKPPIAISSDGETPVLAIDRADLPPGALAGTAASAGVVEGIARVVTDPDREVLHAGEILVAPFTDPGWTPLFVHAAGVVTEVGGLMTHGAVVAREYGIPAVVSVSDAMKRIRTGQRIRVDGSRGFVELL
jgi:pyruvate,water dikinase